MIKVGNRRIVDYRQDTEHQVVDSSPSYHETYNLTDGSMVTFFHWTKKDLNEMREDINYLINEVIEGRDPSDETN